MPSAWWTAWDFSKAEASKQMAGVEEAGAARREQEKISGKEDNKEKLNRKMLRAVVSEQGSALIAGMAVSAFFSLMV